MFVKLCLHLSFIAQNSFQFDEIFFLHVFMRQHLTAILGNIGTKIDLPL